MQGELALKTDAGEPGPARLVDLLPSRLSKLEGAATEYFALWSLLMAAKAGERDAGLAVLHQGGAYRALVDDDQRKAESFLKLIASLRRDLVGESV